MKESRADTEAAEPTVTKGRETGAADMAPSAPRFTSDHTNCRTSPSRKVLVLKNPGSSMLLVLEAQELAGLS